MDVTSKRLETSTRHSPILEECKRQKEARSFLCNAWKEEVQLYEGGDGKSSRNCPNHGKVENTNLFPYHSALYPLLDCYESIQDYNMYALYCIDNVVRPSHAPMPYEYNGHRRSRFTPRIDRHGVHIEELATLNGHLPNSAWAIKQTLMPEKRKIEFLQYEKSQKSMNNRDVRNAQIIRDGNIQDEASRQNNNRFWNVLMNPVPEKSSVILSDVSIPPNDDWEDVEEGEEGDWEDLEEGDDKNNGTPDTKQDARDARDFSYLRWWEHTIVKERRDIVMSNIQPSEILQNSAQDLYSPENLFSDSPSSAMFILLKVLKHSLSELQRDHRLARTVILLISDLRLCDDNTINKSTGMECLRSILTIVSSEYIESCGGYCHEWFISNGGNSDSDNEYQDIDHSPTLNAPNHYCSDWWDFLGSLSTLLAFGIIYMSEQHANLICAFVSQDISRASCSVGSDVSADEPLTGSDYLKQNIYFNSVNEDDTQDRNTQLNLNLLLTIVSAVRQHARSDRTKLAKLLDELQDDEDDEQITRCVQSFNVCVNIMVDIGERILLSLVNTSSGRELGGMVVRGLVESFMNIGSSNISSTSSEVKPLSYLGREKDASLRSLVDPHRYSDAITNACNNPLLDVSISRDNSITTGRRSIEQLIGPQPPKDVQDIVKALFAREMVDVQVSGCGYGDFLVWCQLPVSPDQMLFDYTSNWPQLRSVEGEPQNCWMADENETELDYAHLSARYDLTLLMLLRAWHSPWTPSSHLSYSVPFRRSISTLALCAHRYQIPSDIVVHVNSFLQRSWWQDDRQCCWSRDCQLSKMKKSFQTKILSRQGNWDAGSSTGTAGNKFPPLVVCPGCKVASVCSRECWKHLHQDGHKRHCGRPPFRTPFSDEDNNLCRQLFGTEEEDQEFVSEDIVDDDESWESVDSDEEVTDASRSDIVFSFFNNKVYKHQQREALPFAHLH